MNNHFIAPLSELLDSFGKSDELPAFLEYSCPRNPDIEHFFKRSAVPFDRQGIAKTTLVLLPEESLVLSGYFTLANKLFRVSRGTMSNTAWKRIQKFGTLSENESVCYVAAPLIAQLGKNYSVPENQRIPGSELLNLAFSSIKTVQSIIGGKIVFLECEDKEKLLEFYTSNGFSEFDRRPCGDKTMVQMLCYL